MPKRKEPIQSRPKRRSHASKEPARPSKQNAKKTQRSEVDEFLSGIGVPEKHRFVPDRFQLEAIELVTTHNLDVLVSAPTGSGKTWIATESIRKVLESGSRAWYTTPLKALSNDKFREFGRIFGAENVGIITGDRKVNPDAPLIVATTEIYRNSLYDAMNNLESMNTCLVVLDEVHYLADPERGVVWEESIVYSPAVIRILMLSATVGNAKELAEWVSWARGCECRLVSHPDRPVPMRSGFVSTEGRLLPLLRQDRLHPDILKIYEQDRRYEKHLHLRNPFKYKRGRRQD